MTYNPNAKDWGAAYVGGWQPHPHASIAAHYANGRRATQKAIRNRLLPGATKEDFERWVVVNTPWRFFARPDQLPPAGNWQIWLMQSGRGAGKTRAGSEWLFEQAAGRRDQLCGVTSPTFDDLDKVTFDGPSGIMRICDRHPRLIKRYTKRPWMVELTNGSKITSFTGEAYERLRGPQFHAHLMDEAAGMARVADKAFEQIMFGLRLKGPNGEHPRLMITSTPKAIPLFKRLNDRAAQGDPAVAITRASTMDNRANLSELAISELIASYGGSRLGRQELEGELLTDVPGALWTPDMIQQVSLPANFDRIVVAVDPSGASDEKSESDEIGIVAVGLKRGKTRDDDRYTVLEDATMLGSPHQWGTRAVRAFEEWEADKLVAEGNFGGGMVKSTIHNVDATIPVKIVTASRGKAVRAEPVATLFEQGRCAMAGRFPKLEDQMFNMTSAGYVGTGSPDRLDAMVWAFTELMEGARAPRAIVGGNDQRSYWRPA